MGNRVKKLSILGSTGSIGRQALEVVRSFPQRFKVIGLAGGANTTLLAKQIAEFKPQLVSVQDPSTEPLLSGVKEPHFKLASMEDLSSHPQVDLVVIATTGKVGLSPTLTAVGAGKSIALANKEVLVMAGELVMTEAKKSGAALLPIDSEHSAIWQCLAGEKGQSNSPSNIARIILTASGGAFRDCDMEQLKRVTPAQALKHPTWLMGKKVTLDSATLMNKGMEVIEAHWLFGQPFDKIEVILHRQSIIHSMVEFTDGSVKAQLSLPDMRLPIQYALSYPERWPSPIMPRLDIGKVSSLTFEAIDLKRYPCLELALEAGRAGGTLPTVLAAADEMAVNMFLDNRINFMDIASMVQRATDEHRSISSPSLDDILAADAWARSQVELWGKNR